MPDPAVVGSLIVASLAKVAAPAAAALLTDSELLERVLTVSLTDAAGRSPAHIQRLLKKLGLRRSVLRAMETPTLVDVLGISWSAYLSTLHADELRQAFGVDAKTVLRRLDPKWFIDALLDYDYSGARPLLVVDGLHAEFSADELARLSRHLVSSAQDELDLEVEPDGAVESFVHHAISQLPRRAAQILRESPQTVQHVTLLSVEAVQRDWIESD